MLQGIKVVFAWLTASKAWPLGSSQCATVARLYVRPAISFAIENRAAQCIASLCAYDRVGEAEQHEELSESNTACRNALRHGHGNQCTGFHWNRDCPATASPCGCGCARKASSSVRVGRGL